MEVPRKTVITVEHSVRSAQVAVNKRDGNGELNKGYPQRRAKCKGAGRCDEDTSHFFIKSSIGKAVFALK